MHPLTRRLFNSKNAKAALISLSLFILLELWVYLAAFQNPLADSNHRVWEGPVSLFLLLLGLLFALRFFATEVKTRAPLLLTALALLFIVTLALIPVTPPPPSQWRIEVYKGERILKTFYQDKLVKEYKVALGPNPIGDKQVMSDGQTPLGQFIICDKGPSQFHKWLGLNYPTRDDAWRGRKSAKITWAEFWYITVENLNGRIPYGNSALGGAIGIHGGGRGKDWTLGCVALENDKIDEFFPEIPIGTEVEVFP